MTAEQLGRSWPLAVALGALCACSAPRFEKPRPPDMTEVLQRFESPTGRFVPDDAAALGTALALFTRAVGDTDVVGRLTVLLSDVLAVIPTSGQSAMPVGPDAGPRLQLDLPFDANGYLVFTRLCGGWTLPASPDPANGKAYLTATVSDDGLDPVLWGSVENCRYRVGDLRIELTPSSQRDALRLYWGDGVRSETQSGVGALISLALRANIEGADIDLDVDLRLAGADALDYLLPAGGGSVVVRAGADGSFTVRSADGFFVCDASYNCNRSQSGAGDAL